MSGKVKRKTTSKFFIFLVSFSVFVLAVFLYHRVLTAYFVSEDYQWLPHVGEFEWFKSWRLFLPQVFNKLGGESYFRPLAAWTLWLTAALFGVKPLAFHLTNLFFHLLNAGLVVFLAFSFFEKNFLATFLAGLFFITFPFHAESVSWSVGGRYDLVMTFFYLFGLWAIVKQQETKNQIWLILAALGFFLGFLAKETAISFPLAALGLMIALMNKPVVKVIKKYWFFFLSLILITGFFLRSLVVRATNVYVAEQMAAFYVSRVFKLYLVVFIVLIFFRFLGRRFFSQNFKKREKIFWLLFFLIGLSYLPTANMPTQQRYLYLPSAAVALLFGGVSGFVFDWLKLRQRTLKKVWLVLIFLLLVFNSRLLFLENENWRTAGLLAEQIATSLAEELKNFPEEEAVYVINIPDSIKGAYVYRTHLKKAIEFKMGREAPQLILPPATIGINSQAVIVGPKSLKVESKEGFVIYRPTLDEKGRLIEETSFYRATQLNKKTLWIDFLDENFDWQKSILFKFESGKIERVINELEKEK